MAGLVATELRKCEACKKDYVTALVTDQENELGVWEEPCPYCRVAPAPAARAGKTGAASSH